MRKIDQKGFTLVELLAVIALSSIILAVGYSILFSMMKSAEQSTLQTKLRNESILITQQFDQAMLNIDLIERTGTPNADGTFQSFQGIDQRINEEQPDQVETLVVPFEITADGKLLINHRQMNADGYSLAKTMFKQVNGNLQVYYVIEELKTHKQFTFFKLYNLQGE
ncbi:PulJ/GspJ family protein [Neobacillus sp. SM06]|uniref:PulJ/GspJ family protein n=1 Tax=Neobacillus sp. SM06 TaxID=3422492 RepID=UPI003D2781CA